MGLAYTLTHTHASTHLHWQLNIISIELRHIVKSALGNVFSNEICSSFFISFVCRPRGSCETEKHTHTEKVYTYRGWIHTSVSYYFPHLPWKQFLAVSFPPSAASLRINTIKHAKFTRHTFLVCDVGWKATTQKNRFEIFHRRFSLLFFFLPNDR